jgi:hypothetical protein
MLVEAGAAVNACDSRGRTALHVAVSFNRLDVCRQLLLWKADPTIQTHTQLWTPLHLAALAPQQNLLMIWLLLAGPDLPIEQLAKTMGDRDTSNHAEGGWGVGEGGEEEDEEEDGWESDNDEVDEKGMCEKMEGDVPRLRHGAAWQEYAAENVSYTTLDGLALLRLKGIYPQNWMYSNADQLLEMCMERCRGLPLPPYLSSLALKTAMEETALDAAPEGSRIYAALEAACLLDNERNERLTEDEERASGILRPTLTGEKQMSRLRTRKLALVIGNGKGPGGLDTPVCRADAESVARQLRDVGVTVTLLTDATLQRMLEAIQELTQQVLLLSFLALLVQKYKY